MAVQKKKIKDFENYYIYSDGRVQNCNTNHFLKYTSDKSGYLKVRLYKDKHQHTLLVHRLVALAFLPNPDNYPQVNHKDENKHNNDVSNLEWCTVKYNANYGTRNELIQKQLKQNTTLPDNRKKVNMYTLDGVFIRQFNSLKEAKIFLNKPVTEAHISQCCNGIRKTAYGYKWAKDSECNGGDYYSYCSQNSTEAISNQKV